jgi:hypothetical protein
MIRADGPESKPNNEVHGRPRNSDERRKGDAYRQVIIQFSLTIIHSLVKC